MAKSGEAVKREVQALKHILSNIQNAEVFVRLFDEGTDVSRPTPAVLIEENVYRLLPIEGYNPEQEKWEFLPGSIVRVERKANAEGDYLLATENVM
jgi:hypothetical protein